MAFGIRFRSSGEKAIARAFRELEPKLARKVIRQSLRQGAKVVQEEAKDLAPVDTGAGRKKIRVRASKGPRSSKGKVIALAVLAGDAHGETWYMDLQERGWVTTGGTSVPGKHFMHRAMQAKEPTVQQQIARDILQGVEREAKA